MASSQKIGFLFPGQGAQHVGMGKDLYDTFPAAKNIFDRADNLLGFSVKKLCFEGPEDELTRTRGAQPAIFVHSLAMLAVLDEKHPDLKPAFVAGLSLGEFTALVAGKALSFDDGLKLVQKRAEAMEQAAQNHPGTMASILGLNQAQCEEIAAEAGCQVANLNAPDQIVLSGTEPAIDKACAAAEAKGAKRAIKLKVGGAFHSALMKEAQDELRNALSETSVTSPECLFIPNVTAQAVSDPDEIKSLLSRQLTSPVRWVETMARASETGIGQFIEVGPGKVLKGLAKRSQRDLKIVPCSGPSDLAEIERLLQKTEIQGI
ncbi:ACP S-malonyltransferase [Omnitrophica bacterium]|nr:ACP S-malonyltransferase [Candidatus Omnitrophota bacterium]